jgi:hypothetical protein
MWEKKGLIYNCKGEYSFDFFHCHKPTPLIISDSLIRIYFGLGTITLTRTTYVDVDYSDVENLEVVYIHDKTCY